MNVERLDQRLNVSVYGRCGERRSPKIQPLTRPGIESGTFLLAVRDLTNCANLAHIHWLFSLPIGCRGGQTQPRRWTVRHIQHHPSDALLWLQGHWPLHVRSVFKVSIRCQVQFEKHYPRRCYTMCFNCNFYFKITASYCFVFLRFVFVRQSARLCSYHDNSFASCNTHLKWKLYM